MTAELWAGDYHSIRGRAGRGDLHLVVERWLRELAVAEFPFPVVVKEGMAGVAAVRFLDEGGEIGVFVAGPTSGHLVEDGEVVVRWVRSPVPIPLEVMKLVVGADLQRTGGW